MFRRLKQHYEDWCRRARKRDRLNKVVPKMVVAPSESSGSQSSTSQVDSVLGKPGVRIVTQLKNYFDSIFEYEL